MYKSDEITVTNIDLNDTKSWATSRGGSSHQHFTSKYLKIGIRPKILYIHQKQCFTCLFERLYHTCILKTLLSSSVSSAKIYSKLIIGQAVGTNTKPYTAGMLHHYQPVRVERRRNHKIIAILGHFTDKNGANSGFWIAHWSSYPHCHHNWA